MTCPTQSHKLDSGQSLETFYLDCVEGMVCYLDLEDGLVVVVEDVPAVEDAVLPHREEDGHPHWAPAASVQTRAAGLGPHDRTRLDVLAPNLGCRASGKNVNR